MKKATLFFGILSVLITISCRKTVSTIPPKIEDIGKLSISIVDTLGNKFDTTIQDKFGIDTSENVIEFPSTLNGGTIWIYSWRDSLSLFQLNIGKTKIRNGNYTNTMSYKSTPDVGGYYIVFLLDYPVGRKVYSLIGNSKGVLTISSVDSTLDSKGKKYTTISGKWSGTLHSVECNCEVTGQISWSNFRYKQTY